MSTILEALKKSEQDRKLNDIPTLADMPVPEESTQWRRIAISLSLAIVFLVLCLFVFREYFLEPEEDVGVETIVLNNDTIEQKDKVIDAKTGQAIESILVNVVSYSEDSTLRFAMINGKLFRENEFVHAGLKVEKINRDSVVFNLRGDRIVRKP